MVRSFLRHGSKHMGQVRHKSAATTHAVRAAIQRSIARQSRLSAMRGASVARAAEPGTGHQPKDRGQVAQAGDGRGYEDGSERTAIYGPDRGRRRGDCRIPSSYAAADGRLPLCAPAVDPASIARQSFVKQTMRRYPPISAIHLGCGNWPEIRTAYC